MSECVLFVLLWTRGRGGRGDRMVFTTQQPMHLTPCEFECSLWRGVIDTTLCEKVSQ